jgi:DNA replication ATP-dependent helicase Dna2
MSAASEFLMELESKIRAESRHGWENARKRWDCPLGERVASCRAIGPLEVAGMEESEGCWLLHFHPSEEDTAFFREDDRLRLSRNDPDGPGWIRATFLGLTEKGLSVQVEAALDGRDGWTLDEDHLDLSEYYLKALEELAKTEHGRTKVLPVLSGEGVDEIDLDAFDEAKDGMAGAPLDESQADAVARCLASPLFHAVQGPPGTGKTHALAELVRCLVEQGQRVLVCAFTHRAIHHALRKVRSGVECPVYKVSEVISQDGDGIEFRNGFAATGLGGHSGPYVLGITPFSLFTSRAAEARFDVAVIDETSQMRVEAAMMPMLRADRFFFFGDHRQLPPVVQRPIEDPAEDSIFARLAKGRNRTMLRTSYRLNAPLTEWPSESFYGGELMSDAGVASHRFAMKGEAADAILRREPSLVRRELEHEGNRSSSAEEADETAALILAMLEGGTPAHEIGVTVPFRAQAARIRKLLSFRRFDGFPGSRGIAVDTVERFQGQEREVMIVSFAVSDREFMDRLGGFLVMPQRLNVAVTRARTKVILLHSRAFRVWLERREIQDEKAALALSLLRAAGSIPAGDGSWRV